MKVYCANNNTIYNSPKDCAEDLKLDLSAVSRALSGARKRAGVYILSYIDNNDTDPEAVAALRRWMLYSSYSIVI
ncbi:MAG: hypothetical protein IKY16_10445 [Bacteroidales bacterium]|nr:hypothetical protein [Bacteroidales bacterium]